MHAPCIPGLLDPVLHPVASKPIRVRKNVRKVSRETYNVLADTGMLGPACTKVMRSLKHYINSKGECPTPAELCRFMFTNGVIPHFNLNSVAPRITELHIGKVIRVKGQEPRRVGGGEIEKLPVRICRETGGYAHPVRPREKGSELSA